MFITCQSSENHLTNPTLPSTRWNSKTHTPRFDQTNTIKPTHRNTAKKDTTKPTRRYGKKSLISARRDEAPVSVAAPATTEKHQETTTQLNTPSLFNYCHIITAIYLHLPHSHQTNTHAGASMHREVEKLAQTHMDEAGSQKPPVASSCTSWL